MNNLRTAQWLQEQDNFLLLTHRRPDGDTLGSAAALCRGLRALGKTAHILDNPDITPKYAPFVADLTGPDDPAARVVAVDVDDVGMFPTGFDRTVDLCIDHHGSNSGYAAQTCLDPGAAACGEIIMDLLDLLDVDIVGQIGEALYLAIATDTGCFRYANVTPRTLDCAAELLRAGVDAFAINQAAFAGKRLARLQLEAYLTNTMRISADGTWCICALPWSQRQELQLTEDDLDDLASFPRDIDGVRIGVLIKEQADGSCKLSVRTVPGIDASVICRPLGGGGHPGAAGATVRGSIEDAVTAILKCM